MWPTAEWHPACPTVPAGSGPAFVPHRYDVVSGSAEPPGDCTCMPATAAAEVYSQLCHRTTWTPLWLIGEWQDVAHKPTHGASLGGAAPMSGPGDPSPAVGVARWGSPASSAGDSGMAVLGRGLVGPSGIVTGSGKISWYQWRIHAGRQQAKSYQIRSWHSQGSQAWGKRKSIGVCEAGLGPLQASQPLPQANGTHQAEGAALQQELAPEWWQQPVQHRWQQNNRI